MRESVDSKAYVVTFLMKIPYMILFGMTGAILGSGLYLLIMAMQARTPVYYCEKEFYIDFSEDKAKDYYNDFTWNDVLMMDPLLGKVMQKLPEEYGREEIKAMIDADILSDIRYLTIKVQGKNQDLVAVVSEELSLALQQFGQDMKEFASIREMEKGSVLPIKTKWFTWRAAVLGTILFLGIYIFAFSWRFSLQDACYTRKDVERLLGIPALKASDERINNVTKIDFSKPEKRSLQEKEVVLLIPQGKSCRQEIEEFMLTAKQENTVILGAVLINCSKKWLSLYGIKEIEGIYQIKQ